MTRRWLALVLSVALLALPLAAAAHAAADAPALAAACHCEGAPDCDAPACPPATECAPCARVPILLAAEAPLRPDFAGAVAAPGAPSVWRDRVISPAPEPPR